jgi:precorrin-6B C5,15-methyltransferase / cobalt-precorrin-6B C5,C15-methyltransferase
MVTIIGNGMGEYNFSNIDLDLEPYDAILCDVNFQEERKNLKKLKYKEVKEYITQNYRKENILYIVSGSPLFFSAGSIIASQLPKDQVKIIDNISSKDYILANLMIPQNKVESISLHGRDRIDLSKFLTNDYTFILCDKNSIEKIKEITKFLKPNDLAVTIGYKLGYSDEVIEQINIFDFSFRAFDLTKPYVLVIQRLFTPRDMICDDEAFATERGMITKRYKRHLSLQNLDLEPNQILWDIGAGSGSCGIEAYKRYKVKTYFFEKQSQRSEYIKQNLTDHFVVDSELFEGNAVEHFIKIEENPQRIFVGGGGEDVIQKLPYLYERLDQNGVMLINAITLKNLTSMLNVLNEEKIVYEIFSLSLTTYKGSLDLVEPERQLFQIKICKA